MKTTKIKILLACSFLFLGHAQASVKDLGQTGKVYGIAEQDLSVMLKQKLKNIDRTKIQEDFKKKVLKYRAWNTPDLPRAKEARTRVLDVSVTLKEDFGYGDTIIAKKGKRIDPLDDISLSKIYIIIDTEDAAQVRWFKESEYYRRYDVQVMITGGYAQEQRKSLRRRWIFYLSPEIRSKFKLEYTPAIIRQKGKQIEVSEIFVTD